MKKEDENLRLAVKAALTESDKYFNKPTIEGAEPAKVVTIADIEAKWAKEKEEQHKENK